MSAFQEYLIKRLLYSVVVLFALSLMIFFVTQILPGNAATMILGQYATPDRIDVVEKELGLNAPVHIQYIDWITGVVTGNWGDSYTLKVPIRELVIPRFVHSLQLTVLTLLMVVAVGIPMGVMTAIKRDTPFDFAITTVAYLGVSLPEYVLGVLLILLFGGPVFSVFPSGGFTPLKEGVVPWLEHLFLPALTLAIVLLAHITRQTRSEMIEVLQSDYVREARLSGLPEYVVILRHALPNALIPTITILAIDLGYLMGGIVAVELVFSFPGLGRLIIDSIHNRDIPVLQLSVLLIAAVYTFANLLADVLYTVLDPRIDYGE